MIKSFFTLCAFSLVMSGCSILDGGAGKARSGNDYQVGTFGQSSTQSRHELKDYVRELVSDMALNMRSVDASGSMGVTHFVFSGSDYQSTNELGYALADSFMKELHQFGFDTLDVKVTDYIRVTPEGDFAMSKDFLELKPEADMNYVLVGKLIDHKVGYIVHARIVDVKSRKILASAESFIPRKLVNMLVNNRLVSSADTRVEV